MTAKRQTSQPDDALFVLVGLTAGWRKRRVVGRYLAARCDWPVIVPRIPYGLGLHYCIQWLAGTLKLATESHGRLHVLAYIGGGALLRVLSSQGTRLQLGRIVVDRSPIQELAPARLVERLPRGTTALPWIRTMADLADDQVARLPFPATTMGQGLLVETQPSRLARWLGLGPEDVSPDQWRPEVLLPAAREALTVAVSHDEVYDTPTFLEPALSFLTRGTFGSATEFQLNG